MEMMKNGELGRKRSGMSNYSGTLGRVWKRIWSLTLPNKLCFFIWKACRKALAVRHNLERRWISVVNKCDLCGAGDETKAHLFFDYDFSHAFWFGTSLQINMAAMRVNEFLKGWQWIVQRMEKEVDVEVMMQHVVFGFWRIWKCKNEAGLQRGADFTTYGC